MNRYFVPCTLGLEDALIDELKELGVRTPQRAKGGATFRAEATTAYRVCLWTRIGIRVQEQLAVGSIHKARSLYTLAQRVDWTQLIEPDDTLAVHAVVRQSPIRDGRYAGQIIKDAVVDQFRDRFGERPSVDREDPVLPIRAVLRNNQAIIYRDLAGESLHRRGYRPIQVKSPMNECLAAGLLRMAGWDGSTALADPMCGSGTFLIEAALIADDRAPGLTRRFAFEDWKDTDDDAWDAILLDAKQRAAAPSEAPPLIGADRHGGAVEIAKDAAVEAGVAQLIQMETADVASWTPPIKPGLVVVNPPYGVRIGDPGDIEQTWRDLGQFLKRNCGDSTAWVLCGNAELTKFLRMRARQKYPVNNGPIACRWLGYDILPPKPVTAD